MHVEYASVFQRKLGQHGLNRRSLVRNDGSDTPMFTWEFAFKMNSSSTLMGS